MFVSLENGDLIVYKRDSGINSDSDECIDMMNETSERYMCTCSRGIIGKFCYGAVKYVL